MNKDKLIVKQQLAIEELTEIKEDLEQRLKKIHGYLFCIGGPLNDNKLLFNKEQKNYLNNIAREV